MEDPNIDPSATELAAMEAELPEWDRLAVRDHWDAVISEELGAAAPVPSIWSAMGTGERERVRRYERREDAKVLRLVTNDVDASPRVSLPGFGEVA